MNRCVIFAVLLLLTISNISLICGEEFMDNSNVNPRNSYAENREFLTHNNVGVGPTKWIPYMQIVPQPSYFTFDQHATPLFIQPNLNFICSTTCSGLLQRGFARYNQLIFSPGTNVNNNPNHYPVKQNIDVTILQQDKTPPNYIGVDESYSISITVGADINIIANTSIGGLRALESLSQLIQWSVDSNGNNQYIIPSSSVSVMDYPRFKWRGLLIDCSRHYLHVSTLLRLIDSISYAKFNILHWHFVDDQAWPVVSTKFPKFSQNGAYTQAQIYTPEDVSFVLNYANDRGILVIPEFDVPAHCTIWGNGYAETVINCPTNDPLCWQPLMDPTGPAYPYIQGLLSEFGVNFGSGFVHLGGDEVQSFQAWDDSSIIQNFKASNNFTSNFQVRNYFQNTIQNIAEDLNLAPIFWEEVFDQGYSIHPNTIINTWNGPNTTANVVKAGYRVINSYGWYLDQQHPPGGLNYFWGDTYKNFYMNDPVAPGLTPQQQELILGGEASQWAEQIEDSSVETRIWPRTAATAEALWTITSQKNLTAASPRIDIFSCLLRRRGIRSYPLRPASEYINCILPANSPLYNAPADYVLKSEL